MKLTEGTLLPSAFFSTIGNFVLQVILFVTMWTFGMTLGRWAIFAITCHVSQFLTYFGILVFHNHLKRIGYYEKRK